MGAIAISLGGMLVVVAVVRLMIRADRTNRQRAQRRREIWQAEGGAGPDPGDYIKSGGGMI
jgi:hypothetical protein